MIQHYYACFSHTPLRDVCSALERELSLPTFSFDIHDSWEYAWSSIPGELHVNVTLAENAETITTWMDACPDGVNYQIIVTAESVHADLLTCLEYVLKAHLAEYAATPSTTEFW